MDLDLTTFLMEVANFMILVWIMNRLLYKPVRKIIAERQNTLEQTRAEAERIRTEATELGQAFQGRLAAWDAEKAELRLQLQAEISAERQRLLTGLELELSGVREKARVTEERRGEELVRLSEERAIARASWFASRLLTRFATPDLGRQLMEMLLEDLAQFPEEKRRAIIEALGKEEISVYVISAHPLDEYASTAFEARFKEIFPAVKKLSFSVNETLLAGIRVIAGPWNLSANIKDELAFFRGGINGD